MRITDAHVAELEATINDPIVLEQFRAIPPRARKARLERIIEAKYDELKRELQREERKLAARGAELAVMGFKASLQMLDAHRSMANSLKEFVFDQTPDDTASGEFISAHLRLIDEASDLIHQIDLAKEKAVAGRRALERVEEQWKHGVAGACTRLLALNLRGPGLARAVEQISAELNVPGARLREWLDEHQGDQAADGPMRTADKAIAAMVGVDERTVRRWREQPHREFFDRLVTIPFGDEDPEALSFGLASFLGSLGGDSQTNYLGSPGVDPRPNAPPGSGLAGLAALFEQHVREPKNKP